MKVFLVIWMLGINGSVLEIHPMPSVPVCEQLISEIDDWTSSFTNSASGRMKQGTFTQSARCISVIE